MSKRTIDFDSPWKEAIEQYLPFLFALFFPRIYDEIDWSRPARFLDTELQRALRGAKTGRRVADKLIQVWLKDGQDVWVLIHIEVQSRQETGFAHRMFIYHTRIHDRYGREVVSLAILADEGARWRPRRYSYSRWGCTLRFQYPIVKLRDWRSRRAELEASDNPFAIIVLAHLAAQETRRDMVSRLSAKLALIRRLYDRGYDREQIVSLFRFIDWLLELPVELERQVQETIQTMEEERKMPYVTHIERMVREEARREGLQEGRQEGLAEGEREAVRRLLRLRFGNVPEALEARIATAEGQVLDQLFDRAAIAASIEGL